MKKGSTITEIIVYCAILIIVSVFVINSVLILNNSLVNIRLQRRINTNADQSLQRLVREIRLATDINASSTLNISPGNLSLRTFASHTDSAPADAEFYLNSGRFVLRKGSSSPVFLTDANVSVTNFLFRSVNSSTSKAVNFEIGLRTTGESNFASSTFYGTAILRNSN